MHGTRHGEATGSLSAPAATAQAPALAAQRTAVCGGWSSGIHPTPVGAQAHGHTRVRVMTKVRPKQLVQHNQARKIMLTVPNSTSTSFHDAITSSRAAVQGAGTSWSASACPSASHPHTATDSLGVCLPDCGSGMAHHSCTWCSLIAPLDLTNAAVKVAANSWA